MLHDISYSNRMDNHINVNYTPTCSRFYTINSIKCKFFKGGFRIKKPFKQAIIYRKKSFEATSLALA